MELKLDTFLYFYRLSNERITKVLKVLQFVQTVLKLKLIFVFVYVQGLPGNKGEQGQKVGFKFII